MLLFIPTGFSDIAATSLNSSSSGGSVVVWYRSRISGKHFCYSRAFLRGCRAVSYNCFYWRVEPVLFTMGVVLSTTQLLLVSEQIL